MAKSLLVDTDVMVDFLKGYPKAVTLVRKYAATIILSSIVAAKIEHAELKTLNVRHYPMIRGLKSAYKKG